MKIAFRTDASLQIGSGHVMRCLTLADALKGQGADCHFISREHPGHLLEVIRQRGHEVSCLKLCEQHSQGVPLGQTKEIGHLRWGPAHAAWLGSTWQDDARETAAILASLKPGWLVVDHYALDHRWEEVQAPHHGQLLVIDDLADRFHHCDLLLDQNLGRQPEDHTALVRPNCELLIGPQFALLRPEFAALRYYSLQRRRAQPALRHLLISLGGVDQPNATGLVLQALRTCALPPECRITVVMGLTAPWLQDVRELAMQMPWPTAVVVNVDDMAQRMADSDLAIGAGGSTSWERCCLGLPTLIVVLAENQQVGAQALEAAHAARLMGAVSDIAAQLPEAIQELSDTRRAADLSLAASAITDGRGVKKTLKAMGVVNV
jgi:UDP-2,4-diacetamido-2,4,6-trideoxy-beta-L-altropyranose hydrolase